MRGLSGCQFCQCFLELILRLDSEILLDLELLAQVIDELMVFMVMMVVRCLPIFEKFD